MRRIAKRSAIIGRIFSILPIVTPPFVVGLGVTLMMGRSGYVTEWMVAWFGLTNTLHNDWYNHALSLVAFLFGCLDGLGAAGMKMDAFAFLPLFDKGLAWLLPTLLACGLGVMVRGNGKLAAEAA